MNSASLLAPAIARFYEQNNNSTRALVCFRLDYQPLFGKWVRAPPWPERAEEIEPKRSLLHRQPFLVSSRNGGALRDDTKNGWAD